MMKRGSTSTRLTDDGGDTLEPDVRSGVLGGDNSRHVECRQTLVLHSAGIEIFDAHDAESGQVVHASWRSNTLYVCSVAHTFSMHVQRGAEQIIP